MNKQYLQKLIATAEAGDRAAQFDLAMLYYDENSNLYDAEQAFRWFKTAAEQGEPYAQFHLANMYFYGEGCEENNAEYFRWMLAAANQRLVKAQAHLANVYAQGVDDMEPNYVLALKWALRAADAGDLNSMGILWELYDEGLGVEADVEIAETWRQKGENWTEEDQVSQEELFALPPLTDKE